MVAYIKEIAANLIQSLTPKSPPVEGPSPFALTKALLRELERLDPRDFEAANRSRFAECVEELRPWASMNSFGGSSPKLVALTREVSALLDSYRPEGALRSDGELEFHLATLLIELRTLHAMSSAMSRATWLYSVQPMISRASGLCFVIADHVDDAAAGGCAEELARAIAMLEPPPEAHSTETGDDDDGAETAEPSRANPRNEGVWKDIYEKHQALARVLVTRKISAWVLGPAGRRG